MVQQHLASRKGLRAVCTARTNSLVHTSVSSRRTAAERQRRTSSVVVQAAASPETVKWVGNRRPLDLNKSYYPKQEDVDKQKKV